MCSCKQCNESEENNSFWMDVLYYMQENECDESQAIKEIERIYKNVTK